MTRKSERKKIRKTVERILKAAKIPLVGNDVFSQRSIPTDHDELPVILIYPRTENVERNDESPKSYQRNLSLEIEIQTTANDDSQLADELDDLSQCVEDVIEGSKELADLVNDLDLKSTLYDTDSEGSSPIGSVRLNYDLEYYTDEARDDEDLVPFKRAHTDWHLEGDEEKDAEDDFKFSQEK